MHFASAFPPRASRGVNNCKKQRSLPLSPESRRGSTIPGARCLVRLSLPGCRATNHKKSARGRYVPRRRPAYGVSLSGTDEKQNEYKSLRTRREPATAPAWALSWGIEMAKTENRKWPCRLASKSRFTVKIAMAVGCSESVCRSNIGLSPRRAPYLTTMNRSVAREPGPGAPHSSSQSVCAGENDEL